MCSGSVTHETVPIGTTHIKAKPARPAAPAGAGTAPNPVRAVRADVAGEGGGGAAVIHVGDDDDPPPLRLQRFVHITVPTSAVSPLTLCLDSHTPNDVRAVPGTVAGEGGGGAAVTHVDDDEDDPPIWLQRYMRMNAATSAVTAGCFCGLPGEAANSCEVCALCVPS
jgi:hypothetical protein